jgi:hypothetical protein
MRRQKRIFIAGIFLVATLLLMQNVLALGVTPGRTTLNYDESLNYQAFEFTILNTYDKTVHLAITTEGDLREAISLPSNETKLLPNEKSKVITYFLDFDEVTLSPGENKGKITVRQIPDDDEVAMFGAVPAVSMEVVVNIPYPGKYLDSVIHIFESGQNETTEFLIPVVNRGNEKIDFVKGEINITDKGEELTFIETNSFSLEPLERRDLSAQWLANVPKGFYFASIDLIYDDEIATYFKTFKVGDLDIEIFDIFAEDFELGNIVKMNILVENMWNQDLKEVYANLVLYDKNEIKVVDINSAPYDLPSLTRLRIPLYWDTKDVSRGKYTGMIKILSREGLSIERKLVADITDTGIGFELESGGFVLEKEFDSIIPLILAVLVLGIVVLIVVLKNFPKK